MGPDPKKAENRHSTHPGGVVQTALADLGLTVA
jgi:hypothetical protein